MRVGGEVSTNELNQLLPAFDENIFEVHNKKKLLFFKKYWERCI